MSRKHFNASGGSSLPKTGPLGKRFARQCLSCMRELIGFAFDLGLTDVESTTEQGYRTGFSKNFLNFFLLKWLG